MGTKFASHASIQNTPLSKPLPGRTDMVQNSAGAFVFQVEKFDLLKRFLIIGSEGGSYYKTEKELTLDACANLKSCIAENARKTVDTIVEISEEGRAPKNDAALFALASVMAESKSDQDKHYARLAFNKVARIGTHMFHMAEFIKATKGWGNGTRKAFQNWYLQKTPDQIAYQVVKYGQRDGWSHKDILRKAHPFGTPEQNEIFKYVVGKEFDVAKVPEVLRAAIAIKDATESQAIKLIENYNLPFEAVPTHLLSRANVWSALLPNLGMTALVRNLGRLTSLGVINTLNDEAKFVSETLNNQEKINKGKIHPFNMYMALRTYQTGHGDKGALTWKPNKLVLDALEAGFYKSFKSVKPTGKNIQICLDVSGSMAQYMVVGTNITAREAAVVMAMTTVRSEPYVHVMAFCHEYVPFEIGQNETLSSVAGRMQGMLFGATDLSLPARYSLEQKIPVDCFQIYTDNEVNRGMHPREALKQYRSRMNRPTAKQVVAATSLSQFTIADPQDPYSMDICGFDSAAPQVIAGFMNIG